MSRPSKWIVIASLFAGLGICMIVSLFAFGVVEEKPRFVATTMHQIRAWSAFLQPTSTVASKDPLKFDVNMLDIDHGQGIWLSGFPSYGSIEIPLPRDSTLQDLTLNLVGEKDVSDDVVAALRVFVNGQRVMDRLLAPGQGTLQYEFIVPEEMRQASKLSVSMQLHGDISEHVCHNERSSGAVFTILPQTGVKGGLNSPIFSVRDVVAALPTRVDIALPAELDDSALVETAFQLGLRFAQNGYEVNYTRLADIPTEIERGRRPILVAPVEDLLAAKFAPAFDEGIAGFDAAVSVWRRNGISVLAVTRFDRVAASRFLASAITPLAAQSSIAPQRVRLRSSLDGIRARGQGRRVPLAALGVDTQIARVSEKKSWRIAYNLADMPDGRVPSAVNLNLQLPAGPDKVTYTLHADLNGVMIGSRALRADGSNEVVIPLPTHAHEVSNNLTVSLQRQAHDGGCAVSQQKYPVQLLQSSALLFDRQGLNFPAGFVDMPRLLHDGVEVRIPLGGFAARTREALNILTPILAAFLPFGVEPDLHWSDTATAENEIPDRPFVALWHVPPGTSSRVTQIEQRLIGDAIQDPTLALDKVDNVTTIQKVAAMRPDPDRPGRMLVAPGLVVQSVGDAPSPAGVSYAHHDALAIFDDGEALAIDPSGLVQRAARVRAFAGNE